MKKITTFSIFAVLTVVAAFKTDSVALAQHGHEKNMPMGSHSMQTEMKMGSSGMGALSSLSGKEFNIAFLSQMIGHHQGAIAMARQALKNARHAETKREAQKVIADQTKEIKEMTSWLKQWYGVAPSQQQINLMKADMKDMMAMEVTTDRMFFEMMISHHQGAIMMSELALKKSDKPQVKTLARNIIKAQKSEIIRYNGLLKKAK